MKKVVNEQTVAHLWANKIQPEATNQRRTFYFENNTIYSYGSHFPIAIHYKDIVLFTSRTYSNTTSSHISVVRSAASHKELIFCFNPFKASKGEHDENIGNWISLIKASSEKLINARKPDIYINEIAKFTSELNTYISFFNVKLSKEYKALINFTDADSFKASAIEAQKIAKKEKENRVKKGNAFLKKYKEAWRELSGVSYKEKLSNKQLILLNEVLVGLKETWLRIDGAELNTSKGINIPINVAKRLYDYYIRIVQFGGCNGNCDYTIFSYNVNCANENGLIVGCHNIPISEIKYIANKLNWK